MASIGGRLEYATATASSNSRPTLAAAATVTSSARAEQRTEGVCSETAVTELLRSVNGSAALQSASRLRALEFPHLNSGSALGVRARGRQYRERHCNASGKRVRQCTRQCHRLAAD